MQLLGRDDDIRLVKLLEIAQIARDRQTVAGVHEAVDARCALAAVCDRVDGVFRPRCDIAAAENIRIGGLPGDLRGFDKAAVLRFDLCAGKDIAPVGALADGDIDVRAGNDDRFALVEFRRKSTVFVAH